MKKGRFVRTLALACGIAAAVSFAAPGPARGQESGEGVYTQAKEISEAQAILVHMDLLKAGSFKAGAVDGPTSEALREFQCRHSLRENGTLDWETMALLLSHAPPMDSDGDGVPDSKDRCPGTPEGAKVDARGCPVDSDGDGVFDGLDRCPDTPRGAKVDAEGCPMDSDRDGVFDGLDKCPDTPRGAKVDARGCPVDSDGDGVFDGLDRCPDTPRGTKVDAHGCPVEVAEEKPKPAPLFEQGRKTLVLEGVNFETNRAELLPESKARLDRVAESLKAFPEVRVEIQGHTDSTGSAARNKALSQQRADSVRAYLVQKGVAADRLKAKGYGPSQPIADNKTAEGRAKNRRVELKRLD